MKRIWGESIQKSTWIKRLPANWMKHDCMIPFQMLWQRKMCAWIDFHHICKQIDDSLRWWRMLLAPAMKLGSLHQSQRKEYEIKALEAGCTPLVCNEEETTTKMSQKSSRFYNSWKKDKMQMGNVFQNEELRNVKDSVNVRYGFGCCSALGWNGHFVSKHYAQVIPSETGLKGG